jgi:predicted nucleic acid-binding Zn ribbon protein
MATSHSTEDKPPRLCRHCGTEFRPYYGQTRFCSDSCRMAWGKRALGQITSRPCRHCRLDFLPEQGSRRYCSERCRALARFWPLVEQGQGCWLWRSQISSRGYGVTNFLGRTQNAHRVAWIITFGEVLAGLCVLHTCDNRLCVNPAHLFLGTNKDNTDDMFAKGRMMGKLTAAKVRAMRALHAAGTGIREIAERFGVAYGTARLVIRRITWKRFE